MPQWTPKSHIETYFRASVYLEVIVWRSQLRTIPIFPDLPIDPPLSFRVIFILFFWVVIVIINMGNDIHRHAVAMVVVVPYIARPPRRGWRMFRFTWFGWSWFTWFWWSWFARFRRGFARFGRGLARFSGSIIPSLKHIQGIFSVKRNMLWKISINVQYNSSICSRLSSSFVVHHCCSEIRHYYRRHSWRRQLQLQWER